MRRWFKVAAGLLFLSVAISPAVSVAQSKSAAPAITVYKTPT